MFDEIHNTDIRLDQIPTIESGLSIIWAFALTFDGYSRIKDIGTFANRISAEFETNPIITTKLTLTELRACLFYEQRRFRHGSPIDDDPIGTEREYINNLLVEISKRVTDKQIN